MAIRIYEYSGCSTCKKALKYLDTQGIDYEKLPIVEQPPTLAELKRMLSFVKARGGSFKSLFNTSGQLYREMEMGEKLKNGLAEADGLQLLAKHGKLIKRPFLLLDRDGTVGFKEEEWKKLLK